MATKETRLPTGHAIAAEKWKDLKRAFARFFMFKESRHQNEINQFFQLTPTDFQNDKVFEDTDGRQVFTGPIRDPGLLRESRKRAELIMEALKDLPAYGMEDTEDPEKAGTSGEAGKKVDKKKTRQEGDGKGEEEDDENDDEDDEDDIFDTVTLFAGTDHEDGIKHKKAETDDKEKKSRKQVKKKKTGAKPGNWETGASESDEEDILIDDDEPKPKKKKPEAVM